VAAKHDGRSVAGVNVVVQPGATVQVVFRFLGKAHQSDSVSLVHTPMASTVKSSVDNYLDCPSVQEQGTTGAMGAMGENPSPAGENLFATAAWSPRVYRFVT
jgi:hypothetical protein